MWRILLAIEGDEAVVVVVVVLVNDVPEVSPVACVEDENGVS